MIFTRTQTLIAVFLPFQFSNTCSCLWIIFSWGQYWSFGGNGCKWIIVILFGQLSSPILLCLYLDCGIMSDS